MPWPAIIGMALILAIIVAAFFRFRRRDKPSTRRRPIGERLDDEYHGS